MPPPLAITSSDQAAGCLRRSSVAENVLAWFDPLHVGPVPASENLETLSDRRASYFQLQSFGFSRLGHEYFAARNSRIAAAAAETDIVLFFQENLLDQLHQLQVLDYLGGLKERHGQLLAVHFGGFVDELTEVQTLALADEAVDVTAEALELARVAWEAYRQPTPEAWADLALYDTADLPYLGKAIRRALEELPHVGSGLSRSQRQILDHLKRQNLSARDLYREYLRVEPTSHLEDWVFYAILDGMADGPQPLIEGKADLAFNPNMPLIDWRRYVLPEMKLTTYGQAVWREEVDDRKHNGTDHWWGGTHLTDGRVWRWEPRRGQLVPPGTNLEAATAPELAAPSESAA
jgi:hypothetical protein